MQLMYKLSLITMFCLSTQSYAMQQQIQPTLSPELKQYVLNYRIQKFCPTAADTNPQAVTRRTQQPPTFFQKLKEFNDVAQKEGEIRSMNEDPRAVYLNELLVLVLEMFRHCSTFYRYTIHPQQKN